MDKLLIKDKITISRKLQICYYKTKDKNFIKTADKLHIKEKYISTMIAKYF